MQLIQSDLSGKVQPPDEISSAANGEHCAHSGTQHLSFQLRKTQTLRKKNIYALKASLLSGTL
jgi:hypothetical protein